MKSQRKRRINIKIDKLTTSIENTFTGELFKTDVALVTNNDIKLLDPEDWLFDWMREFKSAEGSIFKLVTLENPSVVHGLIHIEDRADHIFIHLIESSQVNVGQEKIYAGVAGNLVAFACKRSFEAGHNGVISFTAKTQLMAHYEKTLGAKRFSYNQMFIDTPEAVLLVRQYFPDFAL